MHFAPGEYIPQFAIIGEPPNTELYRITERPVGDYAKVVKADGTDPTVHTVYMGRWFTFTDKME